MSRKKKLFKRFVENKATEHEIRELFQYMEDWDADDLEREIYRYQPYADIRSLSRGGQWRRWAVAASIFLVVSISLLVYFQSTPKEINIPITDMTGISESATVIAFSNGQVVNMEEEAEAIYIGRGEINAEYTESQNIQDISYSKTRFDRVTTPIGRQITFILPDSTKVKLNGNSALKFAHHLVDGQRYVELEGEAFFEVKQQGTPFVVQTKKQHVAVLGTSFNVSAYDNAPSSSVALISGKVELALSDDFQPSSTERIVLNPGDVGVVHVGSEKLHVNQQATEEHMAWMHGRLEFDQESLANIIRRLQYWYDVNVVFHDDVEELKFTGSISRIETMQSVLDKLTLTKKIRYKVKERRIEIMKN